MKVPRRTRVSRRVPRRDQGSNKQKRDQLYRLRILEEEDRVRVGYVDYGSEHDEWRPRRDIVVLSGSGDDPNPDSEDM